MSLPYLSMMRGDDTAFTFTVTNDGVPLDLDGLELTWVAKRDWDAADDAPDTIIKTLDDGITIGEYDGSITVQLEAADTEGIASDWSWRVNHTYVWSLTTVDDYEQRHTRGRGYLNVYRHVTVTTV